MRTFPNNLLSVTVVVALFATGGCYDAAEYIYGDYVGTDPLELYTETTGIHPDASVLQDPNNPFRKDVPVGDMKWEIQSYGSDVAAFYSWASVLAIEPTGENQYYVGLSLGRIYVNGNAIQDDLEDVRTRAIAAYQSVLDNFPDAETFDPTGTFAYELVTPSYQAIIELGGIPEGDWVLVADPSGTPRVVRR